MMCKVPVSFLTLQDCNDGVLLRTWSRGTVRARVHAGIAPGT